jgi:hypothetical protein
MAVFLASWELKEGDIVSPIITSSNGLLRYQLDDRVQVSGFWQGVPCLQFLGRRFGVDMVGEKMSPDAARGAMTQVAQKFDLESISLMAVNGENHIVRVIWRCLVKKTYIRLMCLGLILPQPSKKNYAAIFIMN